jgi:hypothetical protein
MFSYHFPVLVEFVDPGIMFEERRYPVHQMVKHTEMDNIKNVRNVDCHRRDAFYIPEDTF